MHRCGAFAGGAPGLKCVARHRVENEKLRATRFRGEALRGAAVGDAHRRSTRNLARDCARSDAPHARPRVRAASPTEALDSSPRTRDARRISLPSYLPVDLPPNRIHPCILDARHGAYSTSRCAPGWQYRVRYSGTWAMARFPRWTLRRTAHRLGTMMARGDAADASQVWRTPSIRKVPPCSDGQPVTRLAPAWPLEG
jgi:hypothetical protein